jgi:tetratricopeptide (TPR) repeat protein
MVLWRFIWFRYAAYGVAWAVGEARRWLVSGWRAHAIGLAAVGGAGMWLDYKQTGTFNARTFVAWTFVAEVAVVYGLLWLIVQAYRSSGRFVVLTTVNHAGKDFDSFAAGLAPHLANDLRLLSELYKTIDDANPPQRDGFFTGKASSTLKVEVDDPADALATVVGEKSDVKLGLVSVSLRPLIAAFERSIPTQRLSSSLHRTGNQLTLLADMAGAEGNWRVERNLPAHASAENTASILREMAKELVYRVFTTNVPTGSKEWGAVERFSEGLRAYRSTLTTDMDSKINLREAERHFFAALRVDKTFARCSYNLGIVYRDLKKMTNARAAFEQAIRDNPAHADAAYALSRIYFEANQLPLALEFAERAIAHEPRDVRVWTAKGLFWQLLQMNQMEQAEQTKQVDQSKQAKKTEQKGQKAKTEETEESKQAAQTNRIELKNEAAWRSSLKYLETAAALAWRDLCCAAWRTRPLDAPRQWISISFYYLARAHLELNNRRRGVRILRQAIRQRPDPELYFQLGKGLMAPEKVSRADLVRRRLKAYQAALRLARTKRGRAFLNVFVAETSALLQVCEAERSLRNILAELFIPGRQNERVMTARHTALQACDNALASPSIFASPSMFDLPSGKDMLSKLQSVCRKLQDLHRCRVIERIEETFDTVKLGETNSIERLTQAVKHGALRMSEAPAMVPIIAWKRAVFFYSIADSLWQDRPRQAERRLRHAVSRLERHYPAEDELLSCAYERLATAKRVQSQFTDALKFAEKAVELDPFSASKMKEHGLAHWCLGNDDQAEQQLRRSFGLNPSDATTLHFIGAIAMNRGLELTKLEDRRAELAKGIKTFSQAIDLAEDDKYRAQLHFWSAQFHGYLMEYDSAKKQYQMARALGHFPSECYLGLGQNDVEQELFESADRHLRYALQEILQAKRTALPKARPESSTNWWRRPQTSADSRNVPPGYFLLRVCLLLALVAAERAGDVARARRKLGFVGRHMKFLGEPPPTASDFEERYLEIAARYEDYLGWVCRLDNQPRQAREHLEASVKRRSDSENLYHLARVYLEQSAIDRAEECCRRARAADVWGVYSTRIAKVEAEVNRRRNAGTESPMAAVEGDPRETSDAENR